MKLKQWLYGAAALAMLAACSDKNFDPDSGGGDENWGENTSGVGYLGVTLELPSELETRAADEGDQGNDSFDDGLKEEYNVNNAALLLFVGDTESTAQFCGAYALAPEEAFDQPNKDNITVSFQKAAKVKNPAALKSSGQLWGLALVNYDKDHFNIVTDITNDNYGNLTINKPKINTDGTIVTETVEGVIKEVADNVIVTRKTVGANGTGGTAGMTFDAVRRIITNCNFRKYKNSNLSQIFMTNAPLSSVQGTYKSPNGQVIQTLAKINKELLKETELEARQNPAGCIFVERALAKITCSGFPQSVILKHTNVTNSDTGVAGYEDEDVRLQIESVEWVLDNEEPNSFIIRNTADVPTTVWTLSTNNIKGSERWRFIGGVGMNDHDYDSDPSHATTPVKTWYRTYWCVDPAYGDDKLFNNQADVENAPFVTCDVNSVLYSHENTFDVAHQNYQNTTRVVFKVKYSNEAEVKNDAGNWVKMTGDCNLYAIRGELRSFYLQQDAENLFMRSILGSSSLHDLIVELLPAGTQALNYTAQDFIITCANAGVQEADSENGIVEGDYIVKKIAFSDTFKNKLAMNNKTSEYIESELAEVATKVNAANHIVPFTDNTCYYAAYIQHFGKTYCPLSDEVTPAKDWKGNRTDVVYGTDDKADSQYLGRYGLVRNNWYDLNVGSISNLGKATVPDGNAETSDDNNEEEYYISARIHVLSWAKRTQSVIF